MREKRVGDGRSGRRTGLVVRTGRAPLCLLCTPLSPIGSHAVPGWRTSAWPSASSTVCRGGGIGHTPWRGRGTLSAARPCFFFLAAPALPPLLPTLIAPPSSSRQPHQCLQEGQVRRRHPGPQDQVHVQGAGGQGGDVEPAGPQLRGGQERSREGERRGRTPTRAPGPRVFLCVVF